MTFKIEHVNLEDEDEMLYRIDEFDDLEYAYKMFSMYKECESTSEPDVNHIYLIDSDDELIEEHSFN